MARGRGPRAFAGLAVLLLLGFAGAPPKGAEALGGGGLDLSQIGQYIALLQRCGGPTVSSSFGALTLELLNNGAMTTLTDLIGNFTSLVTPATSLAPATPAPPAAGDGAGAKSGGGAVDQMLNLDSEQQATIQTILKQLAGPDFANLLELPTLNKISRALNLTCLVTSSNIQGAIDDEIATLEARPDVARRGRSQTMAVIDQILVALLSQIDTIVSEYQACDGNVLDLAHLVTLVAQFVDGQFQWPNAEKAPPPSQCYVNDPTPTPAAGRGRG